MRTVVGRKRLAVCAIQVPLAGARFAQVRLTPGPTGISRADCISVKPGTMEVTAVCQCRGTGAPYDTP